jgi:hypothetical protein
MRCQLDAKAVTGRLARGWPPVSLVAVSSMFQCSWKGSAVATPSYDGHKAAVTCFLDFHRRCRATMCGFNSHLRYFKREKGLRRLFGSPFSLMQCPPCNNGVTESRRNCPEMAPQRRRNTFRGSGFCAAALAYLAKRSRPKDEGARSTGSPHPYSFHRDRVGRLRASPASLMEGGVLQQGYTALLRVTDLSHQGKPPARLPMGTRSRSQPPRNCTIILPFFGR